MTPASVLVGADGVLRCAWVGGDLEYQRYHDDEWGVPQHGDRELFEKLSLEAFQSGLSWITILRRRPTFRAAFHDFEPRTVAAYTGADVDRLMADPGIIRNRMKIDATIGNAAVVEELTRDDPGAFARLLWSFAPERSERRDTLADVPSSTPESVAGARELKRRGFRFVGPTTLYALMQAVGMVNDHVAGCHRAPVPPEDARDSSR